MSVQVYIPPPDYPYDNNISVTVASRGRYPSPRQPDSTGTVTTVSSARYDSIISRTPSTFTIGQDDHSAGSSYMDFRGQVHDSNEPILPKPQKPDGCARSNRMLIAIIAVLVLIVLAAAGYTMRVTVFNEDNQTEGAQEGNQPVDGIWNDWQPWSNCSATCDNGLMTRNRTCDNPPPSFGGSDCDGSASEDQICKLTNCSVNGNWSVWLPWSSCSASCDNGSRTRNRTCDNPVPAFGGEECDGIDTESEACMIIHCPINGNWSSWQSWSDCSATCGNGVMTRNRTCDNPAPLFGGDYCGSSASENKSCKLTNCPVNGNWSVWLSWSSCSASCDNGTKSRNRTCDNPVPAFGGDECDGIDTESEACMIIHCPIHGNWSSWRPWSDCSTTCGGGIKNRTRVCDNPVPAHSGLDCDGHDFESSTCNDVTCPPPGVWGPWAEWTDCSASCGEGVSSRTRDCDNSAGGECIGTNSETKTCQLLKCYDSWGDWSACSLTCGTGIRTRNRTCDGQYIGQECGWHTPTFRDSKTCQNSAICETSFCGSRSANCSYNHPNRCDMYITCDAGKIMYERMCNVLMRYKVRTDDACKGFCDWEANVPCSL